MKSEIESAERFQPVRLVYMPDGKYQGTWGGYEVEVTIDGWQYRLKTVNGIRSMGAKCVVTVADGSVTVEAE